MMKKIIVFCYILSLLFSCTVDEIEYGNTENVPEGQLVNVSISLKDNQMSTRSGLPVAQEQAVKSVFILVFNSAGIKVSQTYLTSDIATGLSNIQTQSGSGMSIYAFTNLSAQNTGLLAATYAFNHVHTIAQLKAIKLYDLANDLNLNLDLVAYGSVTGKTLAPNATEQVTIQLHYATARVTLYVVTNLATSGDAYTLTDWTVVNYPQYSYLLPQTTDAVVPGDSAAYGNSATSIAWVDTTILISGVPTAAKYAFLYMYENRRGGRKTGSPVDQDQKNKALYAPTGATAMVLRGYYKSTSGNSVTGMTATVYLGGNNYGDYNVLRGNDYSYIVTVTGINDINVDSRVVTNDYGYQVNLFNPTLDSHPDSRPIQIKSWPGTATVTILESDQQTVAPSGFWLRLSKLNIHQFVNNLRPTYGTVSDMVTVLSGLTFTNQAAMSSQMVYLYADENLTTSSRTAYVKVLGTAALAGSQPITIKITQNGYQTMGNAGFRSFNTNGTVNTADDYILVVEKIEETTLNLTPGAAAGTEAITSMQWGFNQTVAEPTANATSDYYYRNGFQSTLWLVYQNLTGAPGSTLRTPYGRLSAASSGSASVTITENAMDPIFNTYPARYCFEKNRDLDGDGKITNPNTKGVNEINWYLPSAEELYSMYVGQYALTNYLTGANYQVSSELYGSSTATNSMSYGTGISGTIGKSSAVSVRCVRRIYQSQPQTTPNSPYVMAGTRIIDNRGYSSSILRTAKVARPVPMNSYNSTINNQLSPQFQVAKTDYLLNGVATMTWSQANGWTTASDNSGATGVTASPATGCQAYSETNYPAGTWRLPTQREMYIILFMRKELIAGQDGYVAMAGGTYWTATNLGGTLGWYGIRSNTTVGFGGKTSLMNVRCIRDLEYRQ